MMTLISIAALLIGAGLGFLVGRQMLKQTMQQRMEASLKSVREEIELKDKEMVQLKQSVADSSYRLRELEKDNRYLKEQIERSK